MKNQLTNLTDLITKFVNSNSASTSSSGTLPSNTIANPRNEPEATKDIVHPTNNGSTKDVQPQVVQSEYLSLRSFLKTGRALIDVFEGELTLRVGKEAITFNLDQTSRYSANYSDMTAKRIDVINMACEEYSQEVLGFSDIISSGNPTPYYDPIVSTTSSTLTLFGNSDFLLEEVDAFLAIEDDPTLPKVDQSYLDPEGDILLLKAFLNDDPSLPLLNQRNYMPEVELKDLPPHLEYAFLEGNDKLPVIIAKNLIVEEKTTFITVLKSHKRAIAWKLFYNKEVIKLLDAGLIYPISDSPWVSPAYCVPKKGVFTVVGNEDNELILTRLVTGWRVCIDYRKLNEATRKDHFPLPFMDQMLERLTRNQYYCFLDGFFGYFQIPIDPKDQEKTTFTCPYGTFAYRRMPFGLCNAPGTFQRKLTEAPILIAPDWDMPFELMCDASDFAIGAFLGKVQINELYDQAYENSLIYKEKTKRLHDSKIKDRVFNIDDRFLLFNSLLKIFSGKLKSHWSGPFTISQVYPYGTVELSQPDGLNFKVNGHRLNHYFG
uniref:Reverse transcriptase domain-containing protein n=1 Tax=Tanacetum cinerariifolium TaxID=118510 RepID=A0A699H320_TANCI|nr:reverse transcriptase domain-containing protein [Tanacetum cinerariifolium]